jgi:hypothetical protein
MFKKGVRFRDVLKYLGRWLKVAFGVVLILIASNIEVWYSIRFVIWMAAFFCEYIDDGADAGSNIYQVLTILLGIFLILVIQLLPSLFVFIFLVKNRIHLIYAILSIPIVIELVDAAQHDYYYLWTSLSWL